MKKRGLKQRPRSIDQNYGSMRVMRLFVFIMGMFMRYGMTVVVVIMAMSVPASF